MEPPLHPPDWSRAVRVGDTVQFRTLPKIETNATLRGPFLPMDKAGNLRVDDGREIWVPALVVRHWGLPQDFQPALNLLVFTDGGLWRARHIESVKHVSQALPDEWCWRRLDESQ